MTLPDTSMHTYVHIPLPHFHTPGMRISLFLLPPVVAFPGVSPTQTFVAACMASGLCFHVSVHVSFSLFRSGCIMQRLRRC